MKSYVFFLVFGIFSGIYAGNLSPKTTNFCRFIDSYHDCIKQTCKDKIYLHSEKLHFDKTGMYLISREQHILQLPTIGHNETGFFVEQGWLCDAFLWECTNPECGARYMTNLAISPDRCGVCGHNGFILVAKMRYDSDEYQ